MDASGLPEVREMVGVFASQTAKTEIELNICGRQIMDAPASILAVFPVDRVATTWSKDRLAPRRRDSPGLRGRVTPDSTLAAGADRPRS